MKRTALAALAAVLLFAAPAGAADGPDLSVDPLALARAGKWECLSPANKTCTQIVKYRFLAGGAIEATETDALGRFTVTATYPVIVKDAAICRRVGPGARVPLDIEENGAPTDAKGIAVITDTWNSLLYPKDEEICIFYRPDGSGWRRGARHDGVESRGYNQPVMWVDATDGWTLATHW